MAKLRLSRRRGEAGDLPPFCICCGERTKLVKDKTFSWHHPGLDALLVFGPCFAGIPCLVGIILIIAQSKRMRVPVPLCQAHQNHWRWRRLLIGLGLAGPLVLVIMGIVLALSLPPATPHDFFPAVAALAMFAALTTFVAWTVMAAVLHNSAIRPREITDDGITLLNVSPGFVRRFHEYKEERECRRSWDEELDEDFYRDDRDA